MKFNKNLLLGVLAAVAVAGCKITDDYTIDPTQATNAPASKVADGVEAALVLMHEGELARTAGMWSRYFTGADRQYISYETYNVTSGDFTNPWGLTYADGIAQARLLQTKAVEAKNSKLEGIAMIWESMMVATAADVWGDVPYSEAANYDKYPTPKYDGQVAVYDALISKLDTAIARLGGIGTFTSTITTAGSWVEVANTLKARIYLHKKDYAKALTAAQNGISSADGDWVATHIGSDIGNANQYAIFCDVTRSNYMTAETAILPAFLTDTLGGAYNRANAKTDDSGRFASYYVEDYYSALDPNMYDGYLTYDASFPLLTYVETQLIIAECQQRLGDVDLAIAALNNARVANEAAFGGTYSAYVTDDFDASLSGMASIAGKTISEAVLVEIQEEKYISLYATIEGFVDLVRKDNVFKAQITPTAGTQLPARFLYSQAELNSNPNAVTANSGVTLFTPTPVNK